MRCEGCDGRFGANGEPEVEVDSQDITDNQIEIDVTLNVPCANCGSEFKTTATSLEAEVDLDSHDDECVIQDPDNTDAEGKPVEVTLESDPDRFRDLADENRTFELGDPNLEVSDDFRPKFTERRDRKTGEMVKHPVKARYQRHYYDITGSVEVTCSACGGVIEVELSTELTAGELEPAQ